MKEFQYIIKKYKNGSVFEKRKVKHGMCNFFMTCILVKHYNYEEFAITRRF